MISSLNLTVDFKRLDTPIVGLQENGFEKYSKTTELHTARTCFLMLIRPVVIRNAFIVRIV